MPGKQICVGLLAHVDAGKTTLAEAILYLNGQIRSLGRVDHGDAFLDTFALERERGITIFSKQARVKFEDSKDLIREITLLDTPGHVDFSAEMERALQVMDAAILVVSGTDGVQSHVETLWRLLSRYKIPTFLFVNKMDLANQNPEAHACLMKELTDKLDDRCIDFTQPHDEETFQESLAMCDEALLESYLSGEKIGTEQVRSLVKTRQVFPCYFGSALKLEGVKELLAGIRAYCPVPDYPDEFGARVYKISRDAQGNRLTHMKITGGMIRVRDTLGEEEKVTQVRMYSGKNFETVPEVSAGEICAITGPEYTYAGEGLGAETEAELPMLEPVLSYRIELPQDVDVHQAFRDLRQLQEEEPQLHLSWEESLGEIHAQLMGEVQIEVLQNLIRERFEYSVKFVEGSILYRETIAAPVVGMGHFEPLRHYAEVHLLLEPLETGSGLVFDTVCPEEMLPGNYQRQILSFLEESSLPGVLTGSEITDMKITLVAAKASEKHTQGGDFREAACRALRQGLCRAENLLLEPVYNFQLEVPAESLGRTLSDINKMYGSADAPQIRNDTAFITGSAPVSTMRGYQSEVSSYTKGRGHLSCRLGGYEPCHNAPEVIETCSYDAFSDPKNPCGSVFCAHGAGYVVAWDQVPSHVHITGTDAFAEAAAKRMSADSSPDKPTGGLTFSANDMQEKTSDFGDSSEKESVDEEELREIFERTYAPVKREKNHYLYSSGAKKRGTSNWAGYENPHAKETAQKEDREECLLVDGYNIIFSWDDLKDLARDNLDAARGRLLDLMSNYQGYKKVHLIVVFDAYKVSGHKTEVSKYHNIYVVYTKEAETADQYIEKTVRLVNKKVHVTVATSDALEQIIIYGAGASRLSAKDLKDELDLMREDLKEHNLDKPSKGGKTYFFDGQEDVKEKIEDSPNKGTSLRNDLKSDS